ncbi:MAG: dihydroorotase [Desulfobulbaceae bacterium]|nr:dihydroorotase [Desulfobulbaceae bacterium]
MSNNFIIKNGRVIDPLNSMDQIHNLIVVNGRIASNATSDQELKIIDAKGTLVMPGLIDMHVHLREPGQEYKEDILSGSKAAAAGGFTGVACMPNTDPVNDCAAVTRFILERASQGFCRVYPVGAISKKSRGESLAEFGEMKEAGIVAVSDDGLPVIDSQLMRRALEYAGGLNLRVISHSEEPTLGKGGSMNEGSVSMNMGLKGIPTATESIMVYRDIALAEYTGIPIHIAHVSTAMSAELIRWAKKRGVPVTAETTPHYLSLTEQEVIGYNTNAKMNPPLRTEEDRQAIRQAVADGTIEVIATDHAPHSILEKDVEFDLASNGIIGLETSVPLTLELVRDRLIDYDRFVHLLSVNPAKILGVTGGSLSPGMPADLTIIDPDIRYTYDVSGIISKSRNSPFIGRELQGRAVLTMVDGRITHNLLN